MNKFVTYAKAVSDIVAKYLFQVIGFLSLLAGLSDISVSVENLKTFAVYFGAFLFLLGSTEPMIAYAKSVFSAAKGKK